MLAKRLLGQKDAKPSWVRKALLEILIIIIGILLSVAITEWFGNRKDNKRETAYLEDLVKDLTNDLEVMEYELHQRTDQLEACENLTGVLNSGSFSTSASFEMAKPLTSLVKTVSFNPSTATFHALESTGRMELIDNDEIVRKLIELYTRYYDLVDQNNDDVTRYRDNFLLPFMVENLNFAASSQTRATVSPFLNSSPTMLSQMVNHIIYNQRSLSSTIVAYDRAIAHARETLTLVEKELE